MVSALLIKSLPSVFESFDLLETFCTYFINKVRALLNLEVFLNNHVSERSGYASSHFAHTFCVTGVMFWCSLSHFITLCPSA